MNHADTVERQPAQHEGVATQLHHWSVPSAAAPSPSAHTGQCTARVVFSSPRVERRLTAGADTSVRLPPQPPGEIRFTCGMGRYRGVIQLVEDRRHLGPARLPGWASGHEEALGLAAILWLCSLPLIALLSVLALGPSATIPGALFALVAWTAGCLWAYRRRHEASTDDRPSTSHTSGHP